MWEKYINNELDRKKVFVSFDNYSDYMIINEYFCLCFGS